MSFGYIKQIKHYDSVGQNTNSVVANTELTDYPYVWLIFGSLRVGLVVRVRGGVLLYGAQKLKRLNA